MKKITLRRALLGLAALAVGIPDYTGTAEQNARLLDALGAGTDPEKTEFLN